MVGRQKTFQQMQKSSNKARKQKARESGQTREGIGAVAVRLLRRYAFTDAPNTSVVLCFPGREVRVVDGGQDEEEQSGGGRGRRGVQRKKR